MPTSHRSRTSPIGRRAKAVAKVPTSNRDLASDDPPDRDRRGRPTGGGAALANGERWDGRRTHIVDRAADYVALHAQGLTVAQIARRRRRSKGYVSILLRLGQALATLPPGEVAAFRSPRITWALAQRLIRTDTPSVEVRAQLRYALGGFSSHNLDRRRRGLRQPASGEVALATAPAPDTPRPRTVAQPGEPSGRRTGTGVLTGWGFDGAFFLDDPPGFVQAHLERLLAVHRAVHHRTERASRLDAARGVTAGQGLRRLTAALEHLEPSTPEHVAALRALEIFEAGMRAAIDGALLALQESMPARDPHDAARTASRRSPATMDRPNSARSPAAATRPPLIVSQAEIDEDLE